MLINNVDDALYYVSSDIVIVSFEMYFQNRFFLSVIGKVNLYLSMRMNQNKDFISPNQDQYISKIIF